MRRVKYYIKILRWLYDNRKWRNSRQKWKALVREMSKDPQ